VAVPTRTVPLAPDTFGERVATWLGIGLLVGLLAGTAIGAARVAAAMF